MTGGALAAALLCAAFGLALAFAPRSAWGPGLLALAVSAAAVAFLPLAEGWRAPVLLGCWASVVIAAAVIHIPRGLPFAAALVLAVNTGVWSGAVIAVTGEGLDLLKALPWSLLCFPAAELVSRKLSIAPKVLASWLAAVALLAATLPMMPVTPGYEPDHMD